MVRLFYQAVSFNWVLCCIASLLHPLYQIHATWPEVAAKYPNSWVLVWYLKIYLLKRVYRKRWSDKVARERGSSQARQQPRSLRTRVCSVFCIIKYLDSQNTPQSTNRSFCQIDTGASQACVAMRTRRRTTAYDRLTSPSGPEIRASPAMYCSSATLSQNSGSPSSPASAHSHSVVPVQSSRAVFRFLDSMSPSLVKLVPDFLSAGIYDQSHLEDFFTWPEKAQRNFLLKTFIGKMNALELGAMLIALNSRRHGWVDATIAIAPTSNLFFDMPLTIALRFLK